MCMKAVLDWFRRKTSNPTTVTPRPNAIPVAVINQCTVLTDAQVQAATNAMQVQVTRDFAPVYGIDAKLTFVPKGQTPATGSWWIVIADDSDMAGALGYHDLTNEGLPISKVFAKTDMKYGANWTITFSHEVLEMLADPWINLCVFNQTSNNTGKLYAYEVCDTCEADIYSYSIDGVQVSDFAYPAWFGVPGATGKLDHMGHVRAPLQILSGGYIGEFDVTAGGGWSQLESEHVRHAHRNNYKIGSRRERRNRGLTNWTKSTAHSKP
jgi:hypothetical protein